MSSPGIGPWIPFNFLGLPEEKSALDTSPIVLIPIPYDSTTSHRTGARDGPRAIIHASYNLEDYDHQLGLDVSAIGIHTTPFLEPHMAGPLEMVDRVARTVGSFASRGKVVGLLGGEHTIAIGAVKAMHEVYPDLSVLYLDAHGDLRDQYMDTKVGHATVARRLTEVCPTVQVGIRSLSLEEVGFIAKGTVKTFLWNESSPEVPQRDTLLSHLTPWVYISIDLDVLDPSIMSAVGTPEPGGMTWSQVVTLVEDVARHRRIVGFDVSELSPGEGPHACSYTAAKLVYKLIACSRWMAPEGTDALRKA